MADILFGQSYYLRFDAKLYSAMQPYPPLGTLYAASYLRERGHTVAVFDAMLAQSEEEWERTLAENKPRYAVLYEDSFNYLSKMCLMRMRHAAFTMMHAAKDHGCTVILSGSDATDHLEVFFEQGADYIIVGEGEITLAELISHLEAPSPESTLRNVKGLVFRNANHSIIRTPPREFIRDLDSLPFPAWDLVNVDRYRDAWKSSHGYFSMNLVTTRGCPYHCNWCAKPIYGQRYNVRSPGNVIAEIKSLSDQFAPDYLEFADDIFGLRPGWIEELADLVTAEGVQIPFKCLLRADLATDGTVQALKRAGCSMVWMGAESGSQRILDAMDKGTRVEQIYAATERLHRAGIQVGFFLQFGYLGEDHADIEKTLQMVRDCAPDDIGISVSYPLPGTKFYERVKSDLGDKQNWNDSEDLAMMYHGTYAPEYYRVLHRAVHYEFRTRRALALMTSPKGIRTRRNEHATRTLISLPANYVRWHWTRRKLDRMRRSSSSDKKAHAHAAISLPR